MVPPSSKARGPASVTHQQAPPLQSELLKAIGALPKTSVQPFRYGGGVTIIEARANCIKQTSIWLDRSSTVLRLQQYIQSRASRPR